MSLDHWVSLAGAVIAFLGLLAVAVQIRDSTRQREAQALVEIYDINRQLLSLGFAHPDLFGVLSDAKDSDPVRTQRYLQLWLNQLSLIHSYLNQSVLKGELKESLLRDIAYFLEPENVQRHWLEFGKYYPESFQALVNDLIKKNGPPQGAAHVHSIG